MAKAQGNNNNKKKKKKNTRKISQHRVFLNFLANNPNVEQTKHFMTQLLTHEQFLVLRELVVNELANNIPDFTHKRIKSELKHRLKTRMQRLARGELKKQNLHYLYPLLKILAHNALRHHGFRY